MLVTRLITFDIKVYLIRTIYIYIAKELSVSKNTCIVTMIKNCIKKNKSKQIIIKDVSYNELKIDLYDPTSPYQNDRNSPLIPVGIKIRYRCAANYTTKSDFQEAFVWCYGNQFTPSALECARTTNTLSLHLLSS